MQQYIYQLVRQFFNTSITSSGDGEIDLGLPVRRFRNTIQLVRLQLDI
jgi:hypothetical protein